MTGRFIQSNRVCCILLFAAMLARFVHQYHVVSVPLIANIELMVRLLVTKPNRGRTPPLNGEWLYLWKKHLLIGKADLKGVGIGQV